LALNELICRGTRDDPRDEEDVGADLDFSKYTRDRVDYESGANARDLWTVIYRAAHRRESTRITERSCQRPRLFPCGASVEEGARELAQTCRDGSMSAPLISGAICAKLRRIHGGLSMPVRESTRNSLQVNGVQQRKRRYSPCVPGLRERLRPSAILERRSSISRLDG